MDIRLGFFSEHFYACPEDELPHHYRFGPLQTAPPCAALILEGYTNSLEARPLTEEWYGKLYLVAVRSEEVLRILATLEKEVVRQELEGRILSTIRYNEGPPTRRQR